MTSQSPLQSVEFDRVLALIAMEAKSSLGKAAVARRAPLRTLAECEEAQARLAEMLRFYQTEGLLPLAGLIDLAPLLSRDTVLELEESWQIVRAVRATQAVRETFVRSDRFPRLRAIGENIADADEAISASALRIAAAPPIAVRFRRRARLDSNRLAGAARVIKVYYICA